MPLLMKVAFFSSGLAYKLGGPSFSEALLIRELRKSLDVDIFVPKDQVESDFLEDYDLKNVTTYKPNEISHLNDRLKSVNLIHLNGHWKWWYSNISNFAVQMGIPYILHPRGMLLIGHRRKQLKRVFNFAIGNAIVKNAAKIIALSEYEKSQFIPYKIAPESIAVIPNPIEEKETLVAEPPKLPAGVKDYFLYLGRIERRKNLVFLVRAHKAYKTLGGKTSLLIMGPVEREYDREIRSTVIECGLEQEVLILPPAYENERDKFLQHSKALVYPATDEPFGRVPFEALSVGATPVVPDLSGAAEYLGPFLPECVYRENDASDLAKTLMTVDAMDPERVDAAREWVKKELSLSSIGKKVLAVYESVITVLPVYKERNAPMTKYPF